MEKYCKIICNKNRKCVEFIKSVDEQDAYKLIGRPSWRHIGKIQGVHLIAYTPTSPIQFVSAIQNTRLINVRDWHYDFSVSLVDGKSSTEISYDNLLDFYCRNCDELSLSTVKAFKEVCINLRDNMALNEELRAEAFNEHGKLI